MNENNNVPSTIEEAVNKLLSDLSIENKQQIKEASEDELINFHFSLGMTIRNQFKLWDENSDLLNDCKKISESQFIMVDDASGIIIEALWERLQEFPPPKIVK